MGPEQNWEKWKRLTSLLAQGLTNEEIAECMGLKRRTVCWYMECLMRRNGLYGTADERRLIVLAVKRRLNLRGVSSP